MLPVKALTSLYGYKFGAVAAPARLRARAVVTSGSDGELVSTCNHTNLGANVTQVCWHGCPPAASATSSALQAAEPIS